MRLSLASLGDLPGSVRRPDFDPREIATGIVHLGLGAFHRAHQAVYTQPLLAADPRWGILGVSLRSAGTRDALAPQDWLYTMAERDGAGEHLTVMAALTGALVAPENPGAVVARLADPAVRVVTLTVTEKGYCRHAASGALDEDDPAIRADLAAPDAPRSVPGMLVAGLRARRTAGLAPFTVLSCDNLPSNGHATRAVLTRFATLLDPDFGRWVEGEVACPDSMVDRIVPATTDADRAGITAALGVEDAWPVIAEPFRQWVIEDRFTQGRPDWAATGAELVSDVRPYEDMKLRLLNASHSSIAYLGQLAGWESVADAMAEPALAAHVAALMRESEATLRVAPGMDLPAYERSLLARFANPALRHRTAQIAMDGSQKLPQRLFAPALDRLTARQAAPRIALGVAAWLRFLQGRADDGSVLTVSDPLADRLTAAARAAADAPGLVAAIFAMTDIVPPALAAHAGFRDEVASALESLATHGAAATLRQTCAVN